MDPVHSRERGEGGIGCMLSLFAVLLLGALSYKLVPVFYSNSVLVSYANDVADQAGISPVPDLEKRLRAKAKDLDIPEALAEGAIGISTTGGKDSGTCTITLEYTRTVDLYGVYPMVIATKKVIAQQYIDAR
jgi:hypothetical protein